MNYDSKSNIGSQVSSPQRDQKSSIINQEQQNSIINNGQSNSIINSSQGSNSMVNQSRKTLIPVLSFENLGSNTKITGNPGEVFEATGIDSSSEKGRLNSSNKIQIAASTDYAEETGSSNDTMGDSLTYIGVSAIHTLSNNSGGAIGDREEFSSLDNISITLPQPVTLGDFYLLNTPILIPWKLYVNKVDTNPDNDIRTLAIGPFFIPQLVIGSATSVVPAQEINQTNKVKVNDIINMTNNMYHYTDGNVIDGSFDGDTSIPASFSSDHGLKGIRVDGITGLGAGEKIRISAQAYGSGEMFNPIAWNGSYDQVHEFEDGVQLSGEIWDNAGYIYALKIEYSADGSFTDSVYANYTNVNWEGDGLSFEDSNYSYTEKIGIYSPGLYWYSIEDMTVDINDFPDNISMLLTINGQPKTLASGGADLSALNKTITGTPARLVDSTDSLFDPFLTYADDNGDIPTRAISSFKSDAILYSVTGAQTVSVDLNTISLSRSEVIYESETTSIISGTSLAQVDNCEGLQIEVATINSDTFSSGSISDAWRVRKVAKLNSRYMLTFVERSICYFGIYDIEDDRHYTPSNLDRLITEGNLPIELDIDNVKVITDKYHSISVVITYGDNSMYMNITRLDEFNGARLLKGSYGSTKILTALSISNNRLVVDDSEITVGTSFNSMEYLYNDKTITKSISMLNGTSDIAYTQQSKGNDLALRSGFSFMSHSRQFVSQNSLIIEDIAPFAIGTIDIPLAAPSYMITPTTDSCVDYSTEYEDINDILTPAPATPALAALAYGEAMFYLRSLMGYNLGGAKSNIGTFVISGGNVKPSIGTAIMAKSPSINTSKDYNVLPIKLIEYIDIESTNILGNVGVSIIPMNNNSFIESNNNLYESSRYKLIPRTLKPLLDTTGTIKSIGNMITSSTDNSTAVYMVDRSNNINYILSIPDVVIGNIVNMNQMVVLIGARGIYLIKGTTYDKIYSFDDLMITATIKAIDGKDFVVYVYSREAAIGTFQVAEGDCEITDGDGTLKINTVSGAYKLFRINRFLHVSELESTSTLASYNYINNNTSISDEIVLIELASGDIQIMSFASSTFSSGVIETRPMSLIQENGSVFYLERIYLTTKGYGNITVTVSNGVSNDINKTVSINSNSDTRILRTAIEVASTEMDYKIMNLTFASTLAIDKIEFQGRFINK